MKTCCPFSYFCKMVRMFSSWKPRIQPLLPCYSAILNRFFVVLPAIFSKDCINVFLEARLNAIPAYSWLFSKFFVVAEKDLLDYWTASDCDCGYNKSFMCVIIGMDSTIGLKNSLFLLIFSCIVSRAVVLNLWYGVVREAF